MQRDHSGFNLARHSPFLYRSYIYDWETQLYYLNSRYYDPEIGRFLNPDEPTFIGAGNSLSPNAYVYCDNDPINCTDNAGYDAILAVLGVGVTTGTANAWNPIGWAILGTVIVGAVIWDIINIKNRISDIKSESITRTKALPDVKPKEQHNKPYQLAYISIFGGLVRLEPKMSFVETLSILGISGATYRISQRFKYSSEFMSPAKAKLQHKGTGNWGIYANTQYAAKALAIVFSSTECPEVHGSGMYPHYHIWNVQKDKHVCHIWYGGVVNY